MTSSRALLCSSYGKGYLSTIFLLFFRLASCLEYDFKAFFCALLPTFFNYHFLLAYPGMVSVSCTCSLVCAVPGAAKYKVSWGVGGTTNTSSVNWKQQQGQETRKKHHQIYMHIYVCSQVPGTKGTYEYSFIFSYLPGDAVCQLSGGGCTVNN